MEFHYNYRICPICEEELTYGKYNITKCQNGCCEYDVDPQGEIVEVTLFEKEHFFIELYKEALLQWHPLEPEDYERQRKLDKNMQKFLERVAYWKEDNRYLNKDLSE